MPSRSQNQCLGDGLRRELLGLSVLTVWRIGNQVLHKGPSNFALIVKLKMSTFLSLRRSAPAKLAFIAILFVAAVVLVRSLSLGSLANVDIAPPKYAIAGRNPRSRSLATSGITSRASGPEEAELLLGGAQDKASDVERYMKLAEEDVAAYRTIEHDADEMKAFDVFASDWQTHLAQVKTLSDLVANGKSREAASFFHGDAFTTFRKAAHELRELVDLTHVKAQAARARGRQTIATAQRFISDLILAMLVLFAGLAFYGVVPLPPSEEPVNLGSANVAHRAALEAIGRADALARSFPEHFLLSAFSSGRKP